LHGRVTRGSHPLALSCVRYISVAPTGRIFVKFDTGYFHGNLEILNLVNIRQKYQVLYTVTYMRSLLSRATHVYEVRQYTKVRQCFHGNACNVCYVADSNTSFMKQQYVVTHSYTVLQETEENDRSSTDQHLGPLCFFNKNTRQAMYVGESISKLQIQVAS
jgi:hypothetical protein